MDQIYALGVSVIEFIQDWFADYDHYFHVINDLANPHYALEWGFPIVSILDSVFAAQLLLCLAFGGWLNAVMKWWLQEDRPYWWVRETDFYPDSNRPILRQTSQTCETGPGCPSGHTQIAAMLLVLVNLWIHHVINDRKWRLPRWERGVYPLCVSALCAVLAARCYIAAHFPHQVLAGAVLGGFLAPFLCIYVSDPYIWQYGSSRSRLSHALGVLALAALTALTYFGMKWLGVDPQWTVKLAFRWCTAPQHISVSTTPLFALAHCLGHLLGAALTVTPSVARYRHYTKGRSLLISAFATTIVILTWYKLEENISKENAFIFYLMHFVLSASKVPMLLKVVPYVSMWPFSGKVKDD